ncbi:MAG: ABC transporter ATP-binding protein [Arenicellales bacterium]|nr:ABC transporter ATP-binding protein [Arenicellales bacterium]|tara:strand:- start:1227 stop:2762 length:1536 start_codon:yes stop_codon:yes gene_type:complete
MNEQPLLALTGICKEFPGCLANDEINLEVAPGEIHALLGENGAGKSTLVKIIYGVLRPDRGQIRWRGEPVEIPNPGNARALGIGMVFQHFSLFEALTTLENVALALPREDPQELRARLSKTADAYGLALQPDRHVHELSMGERQRIEIVRCLLQDPKLLILDEPTSVLTPQESETLFTTLHTLASEGRAILYISHKLEEVRKLCDRATILRGGRRVDGCIPSQETAHSMAEKMIGRRVEQAVKRVDTTAGEVRLEVTDLAVTSDQPHGTNINGVNFSVRAGEIVGIAGIAGNGQIELMGALSGETGPPLAGSVHILGREVADIGPMERRALGAVFVPEERIGQAAVSDLSLTQNSFLTASERMGFVARGLVDWAGVARFAGEILQQFNVKATGTTALASSLSGGNLQKFIVGREILQQPRLLVASQPTWGVDAGAAAAIHEQIQHLVSAGAGALVISQDLDEIFLLCDRIAVISQGTLSDPRPASEVTPEQVGLLMGARHDRASEISHAAA